MSQKIEVHRSIGGGPDDVTVYVDGEYRGDVEHLSDGTWTGDTSMGIFAPSEPFATRDEAVAYVVGPFGTAATQPPRVYADDREETDPCEAGTTGCSIDHTAEQAEVRSESGCETW